jgi:hypothetical protein
LPSDNFSLTVDEILEMLVPTETLIAEFETRILTSLSLISSSTDTEYIRRGAPSTLKVTESTFIL